LIDEGQFGSALIFTPFNYAKGNQYGVEITANFALRGFNAYANFGFERGTGTQIASSQFLFGPDELAFIRNHWVFLDHDQRYTVSVGASYTYKDTTVYADLLYGSGLRSGFTNTDELPGYYPLNLGVTHIFHLPEKYGLLKFRFDVTNVFDQATNCETEPESESSLPIRTATRIFCRYFLVVLERGNQVRHNWNNQCLLK
jgi:hypothetical protein